MSPEDLFLSPDLTEEQACRYLASLGLARPREADRLLQDLAEDLPTREALAGIASPLLQAVADSPDPDAALAGVVGYIARRTSRTGLLHQWRDDPRGLDVLATITGHSPLLTQMLMRSPEYLPWLTALVDRPSADIDDLLEEIAAATDWAAEPAARVDFLRRLQRREVLRTGTRELLGRDTADGTSAQLSTLADVVIADALRCAAQAALGTARSGVAPPLPAVIATGDLGLRELGYAGTLDLVFVCDDKATPQDLDVAEVVARATLDLLAQSIDESYEPRLEGRLRRAEGGRPAVSTLAHYRDAQVGAASPAERLLLAQSRFIAGDTGVGRGFVQWAREAAARGPVMSADALALRPEEPTSRKASDHLEALRRGTGGLDDLRQLRLVPLLRDSRPPSAARATHPRVELAALARNGVVAPEMYDVLADADGALRRAWHRMQLTAPVAPADDLDGEAWANLCARSLGLADAAALDGELRAWRARVHQWPRGTRPVTV